jgi:hypothetical protein
LAEFARVLTGRIRATDDAGLLDARRIGVLLPDTAAWGAWKLADDLRKLLPSSVKWPTCEVYVHPFLDPLGHEEARGAYVHEHNGNPHNGHSKNESGVAPGAGALTLPATSDLCLDRQMDTLG